MSATPHDTAVPQDRLLPPSRDRLLSPDVLKAAAAIVLLAFLSAGAAAIAFPGKFTAGPAPGPGAPWEAFSDFARLEELVSEPGAFLLDARIPELYALGRIPGALSLPADLLEAGDPEAEALMRSIPLDALVITYCSEPLCPLAGRLADRLSSEGYRNIHVFTAGFDGWLFSGRSVEEVQDGG
ncbi:MAG: rhodanese-like domain-containing protein [Deltaproteobacteria bacterium]|nr:rhodanese-like domain-containing protein [Deltaproteobacteria bacterium]